MVTMSYTLEDLEEYAEDEDRDRRHDDHEAGICDPGTCDWCADEEEDALKVHGLDTQ